MEYGAGASPGSGRIVRKDIEGKGLEFLNWDGSTYQKLWVGWWGGHQGGARIDGTPKYKDLSFQAKHSPRAHRKQMKV
jgi:hypothetical protein